MKELMRMSRYLSNFKINDLDRTLVVAPDQTHMRQVSNGKVTVIYVGVGEGSNNKDETEETIVVLSDFA